MENEPELRSAVAEILSIDTGILTPDTEFASFEAYDSTAQLSIMVCLSDFSSKEFSLKEIRDMKTYGDLLALLER